MYNSSSDPYMGLHVNTIAVYFYLINTSYTFTRTQI